VASLSLGIRMSGDEEGGMCCKGLHLYWAPLQWKGGTGLQSPQSPSKRACAYQLRGAWDWSPCVGGSRDRPQPVSRYQGVIQRPFSSTTRHSESAALPLLPTFHHPTHQCVRNCEFLHCTACRQRPVVTSHLHVDCHSIEKKRSEKQR